MPAFPFQLRHLAHLIGPNFRSPLTPDSAGIDSAAEHGAGRGMAQGVAGKIRAGREKQSSSPDWMR